VKATRHLTVSNLPVIVAGFKHHLLVRRLSHEHCNNVSRDLGAGIGKRLVHPVLTDPELSGVVVKHGPTVFGPDLHFTELWNEDLDFLARSEEHPENWPSFEVE
jgi:hypothetical protein